MFKKIALTSLTITAIVTLAFGNPADLTTKGKQLFEGSIRFEQGGPSCITCHNVNSEDLIYGGVFSKDLTKVYERFGDGLVGFLDNPQAGMLTAYGTNSFTDSEKEALVAFFKSVNTEGASEEAGGQWTMLFVGLIGVVVLFILIYFIWWDRKKESVKKDIFDRQLSAIN